MCDPNAKMCVPYPPPPPKCQPDGTLCNSPSQCCSMICGNGFCGGGPPPPPPCKPDGATCGSALECCSNVCNGTCGAQVACAFASTKTCDQCIAQSCCAQIVACNGDATCDTWETCILNCEQQGYSAFQCAKGMCGAPSTPTEQALYNCAGQMCSQQCTKD